MRVLYVIGNTCCFVVLCRGEELVTMLKICLNFEANNSCGGGGGRRDLSHAFSRAWTNCSL